MAPGLGQQPSSSTCILSCSSSSSRAKAASGSDFCSSSNSFKALRLLLFFSTRWYLHTRAGSQGVRPRGAGEAVGSAALLWAGGCPTRCGPREGWGLLCLPLRLAHTRAMARARPEPTAPSPAAAEPYFLLLIFFSRRALAS